MTTVHALDLGGAVPVYWHPDDGLWELLAPFVYETEDGTRIRVEQGFRFDLASVPRAFWGKIAPYELSIEAPLVHDYLYRLKGTFPGGETYTRKWADDVFDEVMAKMGIPAWRRSKAYWAVRIFGGKAWRD